MPLTPQEYNLLKDRLNFSDAIEWLVRDSADDFYSDFFNFEDIKRLKDSYIQRKSHTIFQWNPAPCLMEYVPKKSDGMLREAVWLHPHHRVLYLSVLRHLIHKLDPLIEPNVFSFRLPATRSEGDYPFPSTHRMDNWKIFHTNFRARALEDETGAVLVTDIASYFDHIDCDKLCQRIESILGVSADEVDRAAIKLLKELLAMWYPGGRGLPQNLDASSFLGTLYLQPADRSMSDRRFIYYRYLDDIRICARNLKEAQRALHHLQQVLAKDGLFLSSEKTHIYEKDTPKYESLLDVEDDVFISRLEDSISTRQRANIEPLIPNVFEKLTRHATSLDGDGRKFRAYANRLLDIAEFPELRPIVVPRLKNIVLGWLEKHPERSDYWTKLLIGYVDEEVIDFAKKFLVSGPDISIYNWQRYYLWRLLTCYGGTVPQDLMGAAKHASRSDEASLVAAAAVVFVGKHGDNSDRLNLYNDLYHSQKPYCVKRAILVALQQLHPIEERNRIYDRAVHVELENKELVEYLKSIQVPNYGCKHPRERLFNTVPAPTGPFVRLLRGVGKVQGRVVRYRLSRTDYDYD